MKKLFHCKMIISLIICLTMFTGLAVTAYAATAVCPNGSCRQVVSHTSYQKACPCGGQRYIYDCPRCHAHFIYCTKGHIC